MHILYVPFSLSYNVLLVRRHGWFGCLISLLFRTIVDRFHSKISSILFFFPFVPLFRDLSPFPSSNTYFKHSAGVWFTGINRDLRF